MLPVCSATPSSSSHSLISFHVGPRSLFLPRKYIEDRCTVEDRVSVGLPNGIHTPEVSFKTHAMKFLYANAVERSDQSGSLESSNMYLYRNQSDNIMHGFSNECLYREPQKKSYAMRAINESYPIDDEKFAEDPSMSSGGGLVLDSQNMAEPSMSSYVELQSASPPSGDGLSDLHDQLSLSENLSESAASESLSTTNTTTGILSEKPTLVPDTLDATNDTLSKFKENIENFLSGLTESVNASVGKADNTLKNTSNAITSSLANGLKSITESFENAASGVFSSVDNSSEVAGNKLSGFASEFKENTYKAGVVATDVLRRAVVAVEDSLANAGTFVVYSYGSVKALLPTEVQDVLNLSEERAITVLRPVGTAFQQVYVAIEGLEKYLGFDPNDPIVPFILFLGSFTILGTSYWVFTYGGYSGDLSPESTLELLSGEENVVLIDVRPEDLRERDGVPDLRRGARYRYASVTLPEVDGSLRKLLKRGREVDDALVAVIIRNLKIIQDRSKVIVMDASGAQSKGIARSLRKLGVKRPYLVQGGFRSWVKGGLRIKELKPETTLTILNEDAKAILEDFRPTPVKVIGYGAGLAAGIYALLEWEKTLQILGLIGIGQVVASSC
ncbi:calcium sensing receptor, chloroplastic isoform X2 [Magnolia sinica]|uniref:calcium sensing receptor, chloroplastic isoform X2 n=1 Tax=Magnolia sinica TaxID=86752 RepID=UPI00265B01E9|nr:calcium sensing receptor, chloroplastic isoform X2 [Magnolia sinica]